MHTSRFDFDVAIIGAGLVGLACAEALSEAGFRVILLERHAQLARETSSRNSGVVHAGIYYPPTSLKTHLCQRGRALLLTRAQQGSVTLRPVGKIIVATRPDEVPRLEALERNARAAGVELALLDRSQIKRLEPGVEAVVGLWSPGSGIIDVHELALDYSNRAQNAGAVVARRAEVVALQVSEGGGFELHVRQADHDEFVVHARWVVNAAGLDADRIARLAGIDTDALGLTQHLCKGSYFSVRGELARVVSHLVYPLPDEAGLGIHLTLDLGGSLRAGPDAEYVSERDLSVDEGKREIFANAVRRYLPGLRAEDLHPDFAGLRPKLAGPGEPFRDFVIRHEHGIGLPRLVNLLGIESPGLTASPAIAELVLGIVSGTTGPA